MAGRGPAPAENRRRKNEPARGDWVDLPPLDKPVLPTLPRRAKGEGPWPAATRRAWNSWRKDPVTQLYSEGDIAYALDTISLHASMQFRPALAAEVRLRMEALGLTPKGRQDRRWRQAEAEAQAQEPKGEKKGSKSDRRRRLEIVK